MASIYMTSAIVSVTADIVRQDKIAYLRLFILRHDFPKHFSLKNFRTIIIISRDWSQESKSVCEILQTYHLSMPTKLNGILNRQLLPKLRLKGNYYESIAIRI